MVMLCNALSPGRLGSSGMRLSGTVKMSLSPPDQVPSPIGNSQRDFAASILMALRSISRR